MLSIARFATCSLALLVMTVVVLQPSLAQNDPDEIVQYRQSVMSGQGAHFGAIAAIATGAVAYDDHLVYHARALHELAQMVEPIFPEGSRTSDSRASAEIWTDWDGFVAAANEGVEGTQALLSAVESGDSAAIGAAVQATLDGCRGCHRAFRED